jgi:hypothetical protein
MIRVYGITYGDKTTEYTEFRNDKPEKPWRWENGPMVTISDTLLNDLSDNDIVGVVSWKFGRKANIEKPELMALMNLQQKDGVPAHVFSFSRPLGDIHFMNWSDAGHVGIIDYVRRCCEHCDIEYTNDPKHVIYANQFLARKHVYQDYINTVIKPCLELLEGSMWEEVNRDAGYTQAMKQPTLKEKTGLDFYNYVPFILERMMSQYIFNRDLRVAQMI